MKKYSTPSQARPEVVDAAKAYREMPRRELMAARQSAIAAGDFLTMQAITLVLTETFPAR